MAWLWTTMKAAANCDKHGVGVCSLRTRDSLMRLRACFGRHSRTRLHQTCEGQSAGLKHLSKRKRRKKIDSVSKGDWKRNRTNRTRPETERECGVWTRALLNFRAWSSLEWDATKRDSRVRGRKKEDSGYPEYRSSDIEREDGCHQYPILNMFRVR